MSLRPCHDCGHEVSPSAALCPHCGCAYPARTKKSGCGYALFSVLFFLFVAALAKALTGH